MFRCSRSDDVPVLNASFRSVLSSLPNKRQNRKSNVKRPGKGSFRAGKGLAKFFGGKLTCFALRTNTENLCLPLSNPGKRKYP